MKRTTLTKDQLRGNLAALQALIEERPIEYWSDVLKKWCLCEDLDTDFIHRVKPKPDDLSDEEWYAFLQQVRDERTTPPVQTSLAISTNPLDY